MKVWYGIVLFLVWNELFTDVGVQVVIFSDVAPCTRRVRKVKIQRS